MALERGSKLETIHWGQLVWDANRLRKPAQKTLHTSAQERAGAQTIVTQRAARELAGFVDPLQIEESLEQAYAALRAPETVAHTLSTFGIRNVPAYLRINIWWAEEWLRPDSPYGVRTLDEAERERATELLEHMCEHRVFEKMSRDNLTALADPVIICEAAALERRYVMTEDLLSEAISIETWTRTACDDGLIDEPEIVIYANEELRKWCASHPYYACETVASAFWPTDEDATAEEVENRVREMRPFLAEAKLAEIAHAAVTELDGDNQWPERVAKLRTTLPVRTRAADLRHPANPRTDWTQPTHEQQRVRKLLSWKLVVRADETEVQRLGPHHTYQPFRTFPEGAERALAQFLIDRKIEIEGLPKHHGRHQGAGAFSSAIANGVNSRRTRLLQQSNTRT